MSIILTFMSLVLLVLLVFLAVVFIMSLCDFIECGYEASFEGTVFPWVEYIIKRLFKVLIVFVYREDQILNC